jgi:hypothetical protein
VFTEDRAFRILVRVVVTLAVIVVLTVIIRALT